MKKRIVSRTIQGDVYKNIVNGTGISSLLLVASLYLPIIGFISTVLMPLPILLYRSKLGRKTGAIVPCLTFIVMVILLDRGSMDLLLFTELLLLGFVLSELIEINISIEKTILYACGVILGTGVLGLFFYGAITDKGMVSIISTYVTRNLEMTLALYENMGVSEKSLDLISGQFDRIHYVMVRIIPALVFSFTLFVAWASLLLAKPMLTRRALFFPDFGSLNLWKAPDYLVWVIIGSCVTLLLGDGMLRTLGLNGLIISVAIYLLQGIAIVTFYFDKIGFPRIIRIVLYSLIAMQHLILFGVIGLGFFDMWVNFRRLGKKEEQ